MEWRALVGLRWNVIMSPSLQFLWQSSVFRFIFHWQSFPQLLLYTWDRTGARISKGRLERAPPELPCAWKEAVREYIFIYMFMLLPIYLLHTIPASHVRMYVLYVRCRLAARDADILACHRGVAFLFHSLTHSLFHSFTLTLTLTHSLSPFCSPPVLFFLRFQSHIGLHRARIQNRIYTDIHSHAKRLNNNPRPFPKFGRTYILGPQILLPR